MSNVTALLQLKKCKTSLCICLNLKSVLLRWSCSCLATACLRWKVICQHQKEFKCNCGWPLWHFSADKTLICNCCNDLTPVGGSRCSLEGFYHMYNEIWGEWLFGYLFRNSILGICIVFFSCILHLHFVFLHWFTYKNAYLSFYVNV